MSEPPPATLERIGAGSGAEPIDVFRRSATDTLGYRLGLAFFLAFGAGMLILGLSIEPANDQEKWLWPGFGAGALLLFWGTAVFWWVPFYRHTARTVFLYQDGAIWETIAAGWQAAKWSDAVRVFRSETTTVGPAGSFVRVEFTSESDLHFGPQLVDYQRLAEQVQRFVLRQRLPEVKRRLEAGETVEFGPVSLDREAVEAIDSDTGKPVRIDLAALASVQVRFGVLFLAGSNPDPTAVSVLLADVPNYTVLLGLLPLKPPGMNPELFE